MTFRAQLAGAQCVGIEADPQACSLATAFENYYDTQALFLPITSSEFVKLIDDSEKTTNVKSYDFCFFLSSFM